MVSSSHFKMGRCTFFAIVVAVLSSALLTHAGQPDRPSASKAKPDSPEDSKAKSKNTTSHKGAEPGKTEVPNPVQVNKLIEQLGNDDFETREKAYEKLRDMGPPVQDLLAKARKETKDLETQLRLDRLIADLKPKPPATFKEVSLVLQAKCITCHGGPTPKGGLSMTSRKALVKGGDSGPGIVPGTLRGSLWDKISFGIMPPRGRDGLTNDEATLIQTWLNEGAKE